MSNEALEPSPCFTLGCGSFGFRVFLLLEGFSFARKKVREVGKFVFRFVTCTIEVNAFLEGADWCE
ncbi:hypothetical protein D1B31_04550 [Neobacillus notoginsengisoli]|uniref:Uncharacterized protein n=1 Tax=Neobacillus notoginsengisoli TaxID=1578198 RepID=A0A417YYP3_9BACI|nr:hypothetical protein D1B31_04550 [Neobacillus notoginsengisoli]